MWLILLVLAAVYLIARLSDFDSEKMIERFLIWGCALFIAHTLWAALP
jgi:hypothetical protein